MIGRLKQHYEKLPVEGRKFVTKAAILFIAWKLLYNFILIPIDIPDRQLTYVVGKGTERFLSLFYDNTAYEGLNFILINSRRVCKITPSCNGLELIVLFVGFLLCLPTTRKRFLLFTIAGITGIYILNIFRCAALSVMTLHHNSLKDFAHHYAFKIAVYAFVFLLWVLYSKRNKLLNEG